MTSRLDLLRQRIAEHRIDTIDCGLGDLHGQLRGKRLTVEHFLTIIETGFGMGDGVFSMDHRSVVAPTTFTPAEGGFPDMLVRPLPETFRPIPWRPGAAAVLCEALTERECSPLPICPRQALCRILDEAASAGHHFQAAVELEFYLLPAQRESSPGSRCYALGADALEPVLRAIRQGLSDFGIVVEGSHLECGAGQVEVNVRPVPALTAADDTLYFKAAVKEIAARHGLTATFMAKPWADQPGSGMHLHICLPAERGNRFAKHPSLLEPCVAGLLDHMPALSFLSTTTVNGFKRLVEHSFAPTQATWGEDNRTAAVRVLGRQESRRLEVRIGAADANPYLHLAGCVVSMLDGLTRRLTIPVSQAAAPSLPRNLAAAATAFESDDLIRSALGPTLARHLLEMAGREWRLYQMAVTDWERDRYTEFA